jgi:cell division protein FtsW
MTRRSSGTSNGANASVAAQRAHAPDYLLMTCVLLLATIGLIAVYSSSYALGDAEFGDPNYFVKRQAIGLAGGLVLMFVAMRLNYRMLMRLSPLLMLVALAGLALVLVPGIGHEVNGARRWIQIGSLPPVQPSEFAKLAVVVYMAAWLAAKGAILRDFSLGVVPFVGMVGVIGALIILEPDLGTAIVIAAITGTLFFLAGARIFHVLVLAASALLTLIVLIASGGYRMDRVSAFLAAEDDPLGVGYHAIQMTVALGSGGVSGLGLGVSRGKFFYIPGAHTDGIIAIIGEELGFIGVSLVMGLFLLLFVRGWQIMRRADTQFGSLIAAGVLAWLAFQMLINVGGVTRLLPLTGIPLPFISYGVTSLLATFLAAGVLLSVSRYTLVAPEAEEAETRSTPVRARTATARPRPAGGGAR